MLGKLLLWLCALTFGAYGIACLLSPELAADNAGLAITNGDGYVELGAMYGGLQIGFALYFLLCALRSSLQRAGLALLVLVVGCLGLARLYTAWDADWLVGNYTWGAMAFELAVAVLAAVALRR